MSIVNIEKSDNKDKKIIIIAGVLLILAIISVIILNSNNKKLEPVIEKTEIKKIEPGDYDKEAEDNMKCAVSECSLDCIDGLCECKYTNESNEVETIYCQMWSDINE